ncbi:MAG: zinc ABC transporter substrate-binding protein [Propionibacteriaceae bacterium]|nr:zinc ABC transporter substrate-binding protein [Propionibacteriaceae bacterium]
MKLGALAVASSLLLGGCAAVPTAPPGTITVVVGLYPYAYLAEQIGGDRVSVTNLTQPGAEPHDLELTARQIAAVATADLTIYQAGLQPAVEAAVAENAAPSLEATTVVPLATHDNQVDPHIWLDPVNMVTLADAVAARLTALDPAGAATYATGLAAVTTTLTSLDDRYASTLTACERTVFLTTHDAFWYLAGRYGLTQIAIAGISPDAEPSPLRIAEIHETAQTHHLTTVFFETLAAPELADTIAGDLGLATDVLDPLEGLTAQSRGDDYAQVMTSNLTALAQANGCS